MVEARWVVQADDAVMGWRRGDVVRESRDVEGQRVFTVHRLETAPASVIADRLARVAIAQPMPSSAPGILPLRRAPRRRQVG